MTKAIITIGVTSSGKTTFAEKTIKQSRGKMVNVNRDDTRISLFSINSWKNYNFSREREELVTRVCMDKIRSAHAMNRDVVISDTNLNEFHLENLVENLKAIGFDDIEFMIFNVEKSEIIRRNELRGPWKVGKTIIDGMFERFNDIVPKVMQKYPGKVFIHTDSQKDKPVFDTDLPTCVIVDIDGTLMQHDDNVRCVYDMTKVDLDKPRQNVVDVVNMLAEHHTIIVLSGRHGDSGGEAYTRTLNSFIDNDIAFDEINLKPEAQRMRNTVEFKREFIVNNLVKRYNPILALDDNGRVCSMLRDLGIEAWQVQNNDY